ncbi:MAG: dienelactone hydrolase family protein [Myxococcaceae bacterium]
MKVVLVPGFNGTAKQPMLVRLSRLLCERGLEAQAVTLRSGRPSPGLAEETAQLNRLAGEGPIAIVGRSFGGRVGARLAAQREVAAMVLLGFPIRPPGRPRPDDEAALKALKCPVLILQGAKDELGSPVLLRRLTRGMKNVELSVVKGATHSFGRAEGEVLARAAEWLVGVSSSS